MEAGEEIEQTRHVLVGKTPGGEFVQAQGVEHAAGDAPGFPRGLVAAGQGQRGEVTQAREVGAVHPQQLAPPGQAVAAQAATVGGEAQHRTVDAVLGTHRGDVGVVVLHGDGRHAETLGQDQGSAGRVEIGRAHV